MGRDDQLMTIDGRQDIEDTAAAADTHINGAVLRVSAGEIALTP